MHIRNWIAAVVVSALIVPAVTAAERGILLRASFANAKEKQRHPKPKRARFVEPDLASLAAPALRKNELRKIERTVTAALFDDTVLHIELRRVERNAVDAYVWSGSVEGDDSSSVTIVVKDRAVVASIATAARRYMIEPVEDGAHEAFELDPAAFPKESEPITENAAAPARGLSTLAVPAPPVANDSGSIIDVLVLYTDDLRATLGGTAAAQAAATNAVAATNTAYENSGVVPRLRLAGTAEVQYEESGNLTTTLNQLRATADGVMDQIHALRDQLGADDVSLLVVNGGGSCGIAVILSATFVNNGFNFAPHAFNVVDNDCAVGNLSFPHELGHNFGLAHDRFVSPTATPSHPYAFGFVDTQGQFRDIMAYPDSCNWCPRVQFFSSPSLSLLGRPLGVSFESSPSTSAENVRALNNNASIVANWRQSIIVPPPTPTFTDDPLVPGTTPVKALHITELRTAINDYRVSASLGAFTWTTTVAIDGLITAAQIAELRTALTPALTAYGETATYTNPLAVDDAIRAIDVQELREYLK